MSEVAFDTPAEGGYIPPTAPAPAPSKKVDWRKLYEIKDLKITTPKQAGETEEEERKRKEKNRQVREKGFVPPPTEKTPTLEYDTYRLLVGNANKLQFQYAIEEYLMKICPVVSQSTKRDLISARRNIKNSEGISLTYDTLYEALVEGIKPKNLKYIARAGKNPQQPEYGTYIEYDKPIPTAQEQKAIRIMVDKRYSTIMRQIPPNKTIDELVKKIRNTLSIQVLNLQTAFPQLVDKYGAKETDIVSAIVGLPTPIRIPYQELESLDKDKALAFYKKAPALANFLKAIDSNKYNATFGQETRQELVRERVEKAEEAEAKAEAEAEAEAEERLDQGALFAQKRKKAKESARAILKPYYKKYGDKVFCEPYIDILRREVLGAAALGAKWAVVGDANMFMPEEQDYYNKYFQKSSRALAPTHAFDRQMAETENAKRDHPYNEGGYVSLYGGVGGQAWNADPEFFELGRVRGAGEFYDPTYNNYGGQTDYRGRGGLPDEVIEAKIKRRARFKWVDDFNSYMRKIKGVEKRYRFKGDDHGDGHGGLSGLTSKQIDDIISSGVWFIRDIIRQISGEWSGAYARTFRQNAPVYRRSRGLFGEYVERWIYIYNINRELKPDGFDFATWRGDTEKVQKAFMKRMLKKYGEKIYRHYDSITIPATGKFADPPRGSFGLKAYEKYTEVDNTLSCVGDLSAPYGTTDFYSNHWEWEVKKYGDVWENEGVSEEDIKNWDIMKLDWKKRKDKDKEGNSLYNIDVPYKFLWGGRSVLYAPESLEFAKGHGGMLLDFISNRIRPNQEPAERGLELTPEGIEDIKNFDMTPKEIKVRKEREPRKPIFTAVRKVGGLQGLLREKDRRKQKKQEKVEVEKARLTTIAVAEKIKKEREARLKKKREEKEKIRAVSARLASPTYKYKLLVKRSKEGDKEAIELLKLLNRRLEEKRRDEPNLPLALGISKEQYTKEVLRSKEGLVLTSKVMGEFFVPNSVWWARKHMNLTPYDLGARNVKKYPKEKQLLWRAENWIARQPEYQKK